MNDRRQAIFPVRRAIERAVATPGARPVRCYPLLLPVWCMEIKATVREAQPYEVFDSFLTRAIAEAGIANPDELARFFGIDGSLVDRALRFLETIGHIRRTDNCLTLTELGAASVRDGCRYVLKEDHQKIYFDSFTSGPMPGSHYSGVTYLTEPALTGPDGTRFQQIMSLEPFDNRALPHLLNRPDRREFNIPDGLSDAQPVSTQQQWLPAYIIENAGIPPYLAFTMASEGHDRHVETICAALRDSLAAEKAVDPIAVWREWLTTEGFRTVTPQRLSNGVLRAVLPRDAFGTDARFRLYQLGSFETRRRTFLQLWCADQQLRRRAALERATQIVSSRSVKDRDDLNARLRQLAEQLAVAPLAENEVRSHAKASGDDRVLTALDELTSNEPTSQ